MGVCNECLLYDIEDIDRELEPFSDYISPVVSDLSLVDKDSLYIIIKEITNKELRFITPTAIKYQKAIFTIITFIPHKKIAIQPRIDSKYMIALTTKTEFSQSLNSVEELSGKETKLVNIIKKLKTYEDTREAIYCLKDRLVKALPAKDYPLHQACAKGYTQIVKLFLSMYPSELSIENNDKKTPYELARDNGYHEITQLIEQFKEDILPHICLQSGPGLRSHADSAAHFHPSVPIEE